MTNIELTLLFAFCLVMYLNGKLLDDMRVEWLRVKKSVDYSYTDIRFVQYRIIYTFTTMYVATFCAIGLMNVTTQFWAALGLAALILSVKSRLPSDGDGWDATNIIVGMFLPICYVGFGYMALVFKGI